MDEMEKKDSRLLGKGIFVIEPTHLKRSREQQIVKPSAPTSIICRQPPLSLATATIMPEQQRVTPAVPVSTVCRQKVVKTSPSMIVRKQQSDLVKEIEFTSISKKVVDFVEFINEEQFDKKKLEEDGEESRSTILDVNDTETAEYLSSTTKTVEVQTENSAPDSVKCGFVNLTRGKAVFHLQCFYCPEEYPITCWTEFARHIRNVHPVLEKKYADTDIYRNNDRLLENKSKQINDINSTPGVIRIQLPIDGAVKSLLVDCIESNDVEAQVQMNTLLSTEALLPRCNQSDNIEIQTSQTNNCGGSTTPTLISSTDDNDDSFGSELCMDKGSYNPNVEHSYSQGWHEGASNIGIVLGADSLPGSKHEIRFGKTNPKIAMDFLDQLKKFPCLWYTRLGTTKAYDLALQELMDIMNTRWSLRLTIDTLRRNVERIKYWYNTILKKQDNNVDYRHQFVEYFRKCVELSRVPPILQVSAEQNIYPPRPQPLPRYLCTKSVKREGRLTCPVCDKKFVLEVNLKKHSTIHNISEYPHVCKVCQKRFATKMWLVRHSRCHKPPAFECNICSRKYHFEYDLNMHLKKHRGEYDHICEHCGKQFVSERRYSDHVRHVHNKENRCKICSRFLTNPMALNKHLQKFHRPLVGEIKCRKYSPRRTPNPTKYQYILDPVTKRKRICCPKCDKSYFAYNTLHTHVKQVHGMISMRELRNIIPRSKRNTVDADNTKDIESEPDIDLMSNDTNMNLINEDTDTNLNGNTTDESANNQNEILAEKLLDSEEIHIDDSTQLHNFANIETFNEIESYSKTDQAIYEIEAIERNADTEYLFTNRSDSSIKFI